MTEAGATKLVGDALSRLHDPIALRAHPLAGGPGGPAALRSDLTTAIETLRPTAQVDASSRVWRPYHLLNLRYVEGLDAAEVARRLAVSRSQYYREHEAAVAAVTSVLRERGWADAIVRHGAPRTDAEAPRRPRRRLALIAVRGLSILGVAAAASIGRLAVPSSSPPVSGRLAV